MNLQKQFNALKVSNKKIEQNAYSNDTKKYEYTPVMPHKQKLNSSGILPGWKYTVHRRSIKKHFANLSRIAFKKQRNQRRHIYS
jgi:hypothetical protein